MLAWAGSTIVGKALVTDVPGPTVVVVRLVVAGLLYLPIFLALHRGPERYPPRMWPGLLALGVGAGLSQGFYMLGLERAPASEAALIQLTTPLFVTVASVWLFRERLAGGRLLGLLTALGGATVLITASSEGIGGGQTIGRLLFVCASLAWGAYILVSKRLVANRSPILVLATSNLVAMLASWVVVGPGQLADDLRSTAAWSLTSWAQLVFVVLFGGVLSQALYMRILRRVRASQVAAFQYLQPPLTLSLAALMLGERPSALTLGCGGVILTGLWLLNRPGWRRRRDGGTAGRRDGGTAGRRDSGRSFSLSRRPAVPPSDPDRQ